MKSPSVPTPIQAPILQRASNELLNRPNSGQCQGSQLYSKNEFVNRDLILLDERGHCGPEGSASCQDL
jgi:hypothetical protein